MTHPCPRGHRSTAADYCDECGAPIGGPPGRDASPAMVAEGDAASGVAPAQSSVGTPAASHETVGDPVFCPTCGAPVSGRFCESCGVDLLMPRLAPVVEAAGATGAATRWRVVVTVDPDYHARMQAVPDTEPVAFPAYRPERRFTLHGERLLIGRRSRSRGIEPEIDLTGPPEDAAVSHAHALLVARPDGGWAVVDLGSANGTYVDDGIDPIAPQVPAPVADGGRIHVGAWTTLTVHRE